MTCWAIIPVKPGSAGKSRLAGVLDAAQRNALVGAMLRVVVGAVQGCNAVTEVRLLGARHGCDLAVGLLPDLREGLNANLHAGLDYAKRAGARRVLVLAGDLPLLTADDVRQMVNVPSGTVVIAPDRHGRGTNALSLPLPQADEFVFAFGPDSLRRHAQEATRLGLLMTAIHSPGLARDIDEPEDLPDAAALAR